MVDERKLRKCIQSVLVISLFRSFCEKNNSTESQQRLRNIFSRTLNPVETTKCLIQNELFEEINAEEAEFFHSLIIAFLKKKTYRRRITDSEKKLLLCQQDNCCAICGETVGSNYHVDHIIPFKYVGDELENNYQILCANCNTKKNASIDYQIRFMLKTI